MRALAVLVVVLGLAACGGGQDLVDGGREDFGGVGEGDDSAGVGEGGGGGGAAPDEGADESGDRQVVTTGWITLVVPDPSMAAEQAARMVEAAGGRVDEQTERPAVGDEGARASMTLRVPAARLSAVMDELEALGELRDLSLSREDVTLTVRDLDARIHALEVSIGRLQDLMAASASTAELLEAETALTERQAELDSLRAQRTYIGEQVALATVRLELLAERGAPAPAPGGFWGGVVTGWTALVTTLNRSVEVIGAIVPWAIFGGILAGIWVLVRRVRRKKPDDVG